MRSMTGYGHGSAGDENYRVVVEVSSVNRRALDISTALPNEWQGIDRAIVSEVRRYVERGKINVRCRAEQARTASLDWEAGRVRDALVRLRAFAESEGMDFRPGADFLLRLITELGTNAPDIPDGEAVWPVVKDALAIAMEGLRKMRGDEGAALRIDLHARLRVLGKAVSAIRVHAADCVPRYRDTLLQRLRRSGLEWDLDDERVLKEVTLFADRCDVSEELTRLESHLVQFNETLGETGAVGRKLDFLCQEIHREINTVASKSTLLEITRQTLECRNELERIREQVQNIE